VHTRAVYGIELSDVLSFERRAIEASKEYSIRVHLTGMNRWKSTAVGSPDALGGVVCAGDVDARDRGAAGAQARVLPAAPSECHVRVCADVYLHTRPLRVLRWKGIP
jgi:hypothetical protein